MAAVSGVRCAEGIARPVCPLRSTLTPATAAKALASPMTPLHKAVRRVTVDEYGYGRRRSKLVVALEKGDLITIRELGRRTKHTARLYDVLWWMLRCEADNARMERLRERKRHKAAR